MTTATDTDPENVNMGFSLPPEMLEMLAMKARESGMEPGDYAGRVICRHLESNPEGLHQEFPRRHIL